MAYTVYKTADGTRVPSVTGVIKQIGWNREALIVWANRSGLDGLSLNDARQGAMSIGTVAHAMIEASIKGEEYDLVGLAPEIVEGARRAFSSWEEWRELIGYRSIAAEVPLVSEEHRFGGTFDCVHIAGKRALTDWKTGAGIYPEHLLQVAAYGRLWNEHHPDEPIETYALLRLGKNEAAFDYHTRAADAGSIGAAWQAFLHARELYDLQKIVKRGA